MTMASRSSWIRLGLLLSAALSAVGVGAQDICACTPRSYDFTLDFSLSCPPVNVTANAGITDTTCQISSFGGDSVVNLVPVEVDFIDILEIGQDNLVYNQNNVTGSFMDGDSFTYESSINDFSGEENEIPRTLQLNLFGFNSENQRIVNFYGIEFSNDCDVYPVINVGGSAGWTRFSQLMPPPRELCSSAPMPPTSPPTSSLSAAPSSTISTAPPTLGPIDPDPSGPPAALPTATPVNVPPSDAPIDPTETPSSTPTEASTDDSPTEPPIDTVPSNSPTEAPFEAPIVSPSETPVEPPVNVPPTEAPVVVSPPPTPSPTLGPVPTTAGPTGFSMSMNFDSLDQELFGRSYDDFDAPSYKSGKRSPKNKNSTSSSKKSKVDSDHADSKKAKSSSKKASGSKKSSKSSSSAGSSSRRRALEENVRYAGRRLRTTYVVEQ